MRLKEVLRGYAGRELVALPAQVPVLKGERASRELVGWQGDAIGVGGKAPAEVHISSLHGPLLHHHIHIHLGLILWIGLGHDLRGTVKLEGMLNAAREAGELVPEATAWMHSIKSITWKQSVRAERGSAAWEAQHGNKAASREICTR